MTPPAKRVLIVDDHVVVREGIKHVFEGDEAVWGEAGNAREAVDLARAEAWDLVILDISLGDVSGLDVLRQLKELRPRLPVLVYTVHRERQYARRSFKSGADGFVTKDSSLDELRQAARKIMAGGKHVSPALAETFLADLESGELRQPHESLSSREFEVVRLIAQGRSVGEIATLLSLSGRTVSTYRSRALEKMGLRTNAELVQYAVQNGMT